ncbi:Copia protein [Termitomyces sp. T112]|nr:Copia protein [Termitomyces sp. T112]
MTISGKEMKGIESSVTAFTTDQIAEMWKVNHSSNPLILPVGKVTTGWTGHILNKDDGKWADWSYSMNLELSMVQLWEYVFSVPVAPHPIYEPCHVISPSEQKLCAEEWDPVALWAYLKQRHGGAVLVQQVHLLQEALTTKCSPSESLTKTADTIIQKIEHAFEAGEVTKELLQSIAILSALSDKSYAHICSIISWDLTATGNIKVYGPTKIRCFLEGEQMLIDADKSSSTDIVLAAVQTLKHSKYARLMCDGCKSRSRLNFTGHTQLWCILEGGGMAGKTMEESRAACLASFRVRDKDKKKSNSRITVMPSGGSTFTIKGDLDFIATYMAAREGQTMQPAETEFVGLAFDALPSTGSIDEVEMLEFDTLIVLEEELRAGIHWDDHTNHNQGSKEALSSYTIPLETLPFYLHSGATVHISPDSSDFTSLTQIAEHSIHGIGGSTIAATGIGKIRLCI